MEAFTPPSHPQAEAVAAAVSGAIGRARAVSAIYLGMKPDTVLMAYDAACDVLMLDDNELLECAAALDNPEDSDYLGTAERTYWAGSLRELMDHRVQQWTPRDGIQQATQQAMWRLRSDVAARCLRLMYFREVSNEDYAAGHLNESLLQAASFTGSIVGMACETLTSSPPESTQIAA